MHTCARTRVTKASYDVKKTVGLATDSNDSSVRSAAGTLPKAMVTFLIVTVGWMRLCHIGIR